MVCKRQEQCKLGKMCGWAEDEETLLTECVEFIERVPLTNEEWFDSLTTNEKAYHLADICAWAMEEFRCGKTEKANTGYWQKWLKQPHKPIS